MCNPAYSAQIWQGLIGHTCAKSCATLSICTTFFQWSVKCIAMKMLTIFRKAKLYSADKRSCQLAWTLTYGTVINMHIFSKLWRRGMLAPIFSISTFNNRCCHKHVVGNYYGDPRFYYDAASCEIPYSTAYDCFCSRNRGYDCAYANFIRLHDSCELLLDDSFQSRVQAGYIIAVVCIVIAALFSFLSCVYLCCPHILPAYFHDESLNETNVGVGSVNAAGLSYFRE